MDLIRYKIEQYFNPGHVHKPKFGLLICDVGMSSIFKPDHCTERPSLVLLSAYQEYLMTFKLMMSQVVQRAGPLIMHMCVIGAQRVNSINNMFYFWR